jgi:hypothetical protein
MIDGVRKVLKCKSPSHVRALHTFKEILLNFGIQHGALDPLSFKALAKNSMFSIFYTFQLKLVLREELEIIEMTPM